MFLYNPWNISVPAFEKMSLWHINYLCTYDLYSPVQNDFRAPNGTRLSAMPVHRAQKLSNSGLTPSHLPS